MSDARRIYRNHPTQPEIDEVLGKRTTAALGTINDDGSVHLAYVLFLYAGGHFLIETSSVTRKARNCAARGTATILVQGAASSGRSLMVSAECTARLMTGADATAANRLVRTKYLVPGALDAIERAWGGDIDDVAIELFPVRWRSWTGTLLEEAAVRELGTDYEDAWLPEQD